MKADKDFHKIRLRYSANGTSNGNPVNGDLKTTVHSDNNFGTSYTASGNSFTLPNTGGWSNWEEITFDISGNEGEYIHLRNNNSPSGINVDWIEFVKPYFFLAGNGVTAMCPDANLGGPE